MAAILRCVVRRGLTQLSAPSQRLFGSTSFVMFGDEYGSGAGKGGGSGGSIRDAGGSFGKMEAAHEEQYFRKMQAEQLKSLKSHHDEEIRHHEDAIRRHQEAVNRHKKKISFLDKAEKK